MHSTVGMAGAVYCGMLVALVDLINPGAEEFTRCRFHESYNEHGRGRWKSRR
jgi:hypothetical protein